MDTYKLCGGCGKVASSFFAVRCGKCGGKIIEKELPKCPNCGKSLLFKFKFCEFCGELLEGSSKE